MVVLGIDPSLANTCIVVGELSDKGFSPITYKVISTEKTQTKQIRASSDLIDRCREIHRALEFFCEKYSPGMIFVETPSGSQSASAMKGYGVSCALIATLKPSPIEVTPTEVKMASVGVKTASKKEMIDWAFDKYPSVGWECRNGYPLNRMEHLADALAVIEAGVRTPEFIRLRAALGAL